MQAHTVFICHSNKDLATAKRLSDALEAQGIDCWLAPEDNRGGDEYADAGARRSMATRRVQPVA